MLQLLSLLYGIAPISPELDSHLRTVLVPKTYLKGEFLLREGEVANRIHYISKGLVRSYFWSKEREVSSWFMKENDICISVLSFMDQCPSDDNIVALEDTDTWSITYIQLEDIYQRFVEFNRHGRLITTKYYLWRERQQRDTLRHSPMYFYNQLIESDPDLVRRVSPEYLASYLNMGRTTYYRIRQEYANSKKT